VATHNTLSVWTAQGKAISELRSPKAPLHPHPLKHGTSATSSIYNAADFYLYAAVFIFHNRPVFTAEELAYGRGALQEV